MCDLPTVYIKYEMWSKVLFLLLLSNFGFSERDKRTIGILFRGLVDAVTGPAAPLAYPDGNRKTTPKPDSRPQTQIFFVPLPEKYRPAESIMRPAPLKPADLAEIHIHPQLVKQLEALARLQAIRGKMVARRYPINTTNDNIKASDNIKAGDDIKEVKKVKPTTTVPPETSPHIPQASNNIPMKYVVKILPEHIDERGSVEVTISVGKDGKIRILPNKSRLEDKPPREVSNGKESKPSQDDVEVIKKPERPRRPDNQPGSFPNGFPDRPGYQGNPEVPPFLDDPNFPGFILGPGFPRGPGPFPDSYPRGIGPEGYPLGPPNAPTNLRPNFEEVYPPYPAGYNSPPSQSSANPDRPPDRQSKQPQPNYAEPPEQQSRPPYAQVEPYNDFLSYLGLTDKPSSPKPPPKAQKQYKEQNQNDNASRDSPQHNENERPLFSPVPAAYHPGYNPQQDITNQRPQRPPYPQSPYEQGPQSPYNPGFNQGPQSIYNGPQSIFNGPRFPSPQYPSYPPFPTDQFNSIIGNFPSSPNFQIQGLPNLPFDSPRGLPIRGTYEQFGNDFRSWNNPISLRKVDKLSEKCSNKANQTCS